MGKFYWLKLKKDFFKRHDVRIIEGMENGHEMVLFYLKMLCESVDHEGALRFSEEVPYDDRMLSAVTDTDLKVVESTMKELKRLGMIKTLEDGTILMCNTENMLGSETQWAEKKKNQRKLPPLNNGSKRVNGEMLRLPNGKTHFVDEKRYGGFGMYVLDRSGGKCELCGSEDNIIIHHNNGYSNDPDDLICLCSKCHGIAHNSEHSGHIEIDVHHMSTTCPPYVHHMSDKSKRKSKSIEKEIDIEEIDNDKSLSLSSKPREIPSLNDVVKFAVNQKINRVIDPEQFFNFYQDLEWKINGKPIMDWRSLLMTWANKVKGGKNVHREITMNELEPTIRDQKWDGVTMPLDDRDKARLCDEDRDRYEKAYLDYLVGDYREDGEV